MKLPSSAFLWTVIIIGILLRFVDLTVPDMDTDSAQYVMGSRSHPPLGVAVFRLAQHVFGYNLTVVRGVSAVAGTLTIGVLYVIGRNYFNRQVALLAAAIAAVCTTHILLSRLAFFDPMLGLLWAIALLCFLRARQQTTTATVTFLFLSCAAATLTKNQGFMVPSLFLLGRVVERRGMFWNDTVCWALALSHLPFPIYISAHPEIFAILDIYSDFVGFFDLRQRLIGMVTLWVNSLGPLILLILASVPMLRRLPWPVNAVLLIVANISFILSPRVYYTHVHCVLLLACRAATTESSPGCQAGSPTNCRWFHPAQAGAK